MSKSRNIPIRFSEQMIAEMEQAAQKMDLENRSDLIKVCVKSFLRDFEKYGKACLPVDWMEMKQRMDERTRVSHEITAPLVRAAEPKSTWSAKKKGPKP